MNGADCRRCSLRTRCLPETQENDVAICRFGSTLYFVSVATARVMIPLRENLLYGEAMVHHLLHIAKESGPGDAIPLGIIKFTKDSSIEKPTHRITQSQKA